MSRRSVLRTTTFLIAIGSFAAVGPASAHGFGFGGFGGGQGGPALAMRSPGYATISRAPMQSMGSLGGARFGRSLPVAVPVVESRSVGARIQTSRIPAAMSVPLGNTPAAAQLVRPGQLPQTITSSGIGGPRHVDAAGIVRPNDSVGTQIKDTGEGRGKLQKPGSNPDVPNVTGPVHTIFGQGPSENTNNLGGSGIKVPDGPDINLPGTAKQKGPPAVPGFGDGMGGGARVNLPGSIDQHGVSDASKKLAGAENAGKELLNQATKGGPNSLNTAADAMPGETVSDKYSGETAAGGMGQNYINTGRPVDPIVNTGRPVKVWTSKGSDGNGGTVVVTNVSGPDTDRTTIVNTTKDGKATTKTTSYDPKTGAIISSTMTTTGGDGKNNTPNEDSSNSHDIGGLSAGSSLAKSGQGGGTDNNGTESSGGQTGQLAPGSALGRKGNGDGSGDDHGDNNRVGNDGTLAAGSALARKDYGDGGGSDTRNGGTMTGGVKVRPGGGDPHQSNAAVLGH